MATVTAEEATSYLEGLGHQLEKVEGLGYKNPQVTAAAILHANYPGGFWDERFAFASFPPELPETIRNFGILPSEQRSSTSTRGGIESYLTHFVSATAAYGNPSRFLHLAINAFMIDPGIKVREINEQYPGKLWPSFWNSLGGDMLTDRVYGYEDEDEYRAGLLGMQAVRNMLATNTETTKLSEMVLDAAVNFDSVKGGNYRELMDYQTARRCIRPIFGHRVIRMLTKHIGFFQNNALIPIERAYLN